MIVQRVAAQNNNQLRHILNIWLHHLQRKTTAMTQ